MSEGGPQVAQHVAPGLLGEPDRRGRHARQARAQPPGIGRHGLGRAAQRGRDAAQRGDHVPPPIGAQAALGGVLLPEAGDEIGERRRAGGTKAVSRGWGSRAWGAACSIGRGSSGSRAASGGRARTGGTIREHGSRRTPPTSGGAFARDPAKPLICMDIRGHGGHGGHRQAAWRYAACALALTRSRRPPGPIRIAARSPAAMARRTVLCEQPSRRATSLTLKSALRSGQGSGPGPAPSAAAGAAAADRGAADVGVGLEVGMASLSNAGSSGKLQTHLRSSPGLGLSESASCTLNRWRLATTTRAPTSCGLLVKIRCRGVERGTGTIGGGSAVRRGQAVRRLVGRFGSSLSSLGACSPSRTGWRRLKPR